MWPTASPTTVRRLPTTTSSALNWFAPTICFRHGALSKNDLEVAQNAAEKAKVDVETKEEHLRLIGNDPAHPNAIVDLYAPVSGVITDQQVTNSSGLQALGSNAFMISDLSTVWIVCDVYENDLATVRLGDTAEVRLNAYPGQVLRGTVSNIGASLDPNLRTAKVRVEVANPGLMRLGMFATATFRSSNHGNTHRRARLRHPAHTRPRLCLPAGRRTENSAAWKSSAETRFPTTCRTSSPASSQATAWWRMRSSWSTPSTNK